MSRAAGLMSNAMLDILRSRFAGIQGIDPCKDTYPKLIQLLDGMGQPMLRQLAGAEIKFLSALARNRVKEA